MEGERDGDRGGIFHRRRCLLGGPSMCRETFELSQNLWNSDRGTAERTLDQGSKSLERSAVDWWWSRVHGGARVCVRVHARAFQKTNLKKDKKQCLNLNHIYGRTADDAFRKKKKVMFDF